MSAKDIAVMGVRLIAVYTLVPAFSFASSLMLQTNLPILPVLLQALFMVAAGAVLWLAAPAIALGINKSTEPLQGLGVDLRSLAQVGFGIVGVLLMVQAGSSLVQAVIHLVGVQAAQMAYDPGIAAMYRGELGWAAAQLVLGAAVFVGRRGLAQAIAAVRNY